MPVMENLSMVVLVKYMFTRIAIKRQAPLFERKTIFSDDQRC